MCEDLLHRCLDMLVRLVEGGNDIPPALQAAAAGVLCQLAANNNANQQRIHSSGGLSALVSRRGCRPRRHCKPWCMGTAPTWPESAHWHRTWCQSCRREGLVPCCVNARAATYLATSCWPLFSGCASQRQVTAVVVLDGYNRQRMGRES